jgi:Putative beta-barrel porin-2, OmpL-like. bbp2
MRTIASSAIVAIATIGAGVPVLAQTPTPPPATPPAVSATPAPATTSAPAPTTITLPTPGMSGPLAFSPTPFSIDLGPLGKNYITGVLSGLGFEQSNPGPGNRNSQIDLDNAQIMLQKTDGILQYYVQVGAYTIPSLGTTYIPVTNTDPDFFGPVPQAFIKIAPTSNFSIEGGKLPTLIGAESTFTFENMNIERGLLWNQEPAVSRGVQANYTAGPVAFALAFNDGYYSDVFNWVSGSATWTINGSNSLVFAAGGNAGSTNKSTIATPLAQNNSSIYDIIYTYTSAPWTITPYVQWSHAPKNPDLGFQQDAWSYGGAVLANYTFNPHFSLAGRVEFIGSTGSLSQGAPNLLYGPGSKALSLTLTPTYQWNRYFLRGEVSYVALLDSVSGYALGSDLNKTNQVRGLLETGILF